ncbi:probable LRR receptor-like serine/threonine-protein kinase At1g06840 isoform X1 [Quercus robur]|uniref:probable LRR receptor-like serine/threonine-protein kinase At1g06840 isoform X1 n=1 Tax=Quercus robur TaxID=38942 RepID=UPI00216254CE|nr:probable LRR receptor-like serine/threonine-protein kinase At1g06840 isoform X1 [Quercus robur]XP_050288133.1 probable LRR receptor-like serine/threonine-protein kinase At1g06840 isoform X1 [Quercus robur]XP_050288140.1 probable LRR receptor-like serine/threonine-protein kinase At1g06840 isoform X1 [Quercus robur]XP_050288147.1 probable LRR receptor-like serine/threonine-protein kinase At1g06840 isoform X1 [Quercus robur]
MHLSRVWTCGLFIVAWLCCSSLLIGAQKPVTSPEEVKALQAIKSSLIDPNGNLSDWDQGDPCTSNWTGVFCYNTPLDDGYLHVKRLLLLRMNLSGTLSPEIGRLSNLTILDFMWNNISGSIPKEIGNIKSLFLLLLNGNQLTGPLPEELGYFPNLDRIQIDENHISGPIPKSFANLNKTRHFHMNNNSISGQIPPELSRLPSLIHFLLDNNNLSGYLPREFSELPNLQILQFDNNNFDGTTIPASYSKMSKLLKLSLRNCSLQGPIPDFSQIPNLYYLDLSSNQLNGTIPSDRFSQNITTILLSHNYISGTIPTNFSDLPHLQRLSIANNSLIGSVPSSIWQSRAFNGMEKFTVELQNNNLANISGTIYLPPNVSVWLQENPLCLNSNLAQFCKPEIEEDKNSQSSTNTTSVCQAHACPSSYEYSPTSPVVCFCALPLFVGYRLKSPAFSDFRPYRFKFEEFLTFHLELSLYQLYIDSFTWEEGPRLGMQLKFFPVSDSVNNANTFNKSEVQRIFDVFTSWKIHNSDLFGPAELISFPILGFYKYDDANSPSSGLSKGALAGLVLGIIAGAVALSAVVTLLILRMHVRNYHALSRRRHSSMSSIKIDGVKDFTYREMAVATSSFDTEVGRGGYGKVYKGILADGVVVAIKRAQEGSLQGEKEFLTEIKLLSRLHHRNLVSLIGYCDEEDEQMLVYEFMSNGTLRDHLSGVHVCNNTAKCKEPLSFAMRLRIALGSAKGILYLHTEADPPVFHRDIKASNILLDSKYMAKVADFGLSRLAPIPDIEGTVPTHISTVVKGTPGYLDPEYFLTRKLTDKSDVYSLGVVFLELLTGKQPISHGKNIVREVNVASKSDMIFSVIDGRMGSYPPKCVVKFLNLALKCCGDETDARPSMAEVVRELESIWHMMPDSDIISVGPMVTNAEKLATPPSSSSTVKDLYASEISGIELVSEVIPSIAPR